MNASRLVAVAILAFAASPALGATGAIPSDAGSNAGPTATAHGPGSQRAVTAMHRLPYGVGPRTRGDLLCALGVRSCTPARLAAPAAPRARRAAR